MATSKNKQKAPSPGVLALYAWLTFVDGLVKIVRVLAVPGCAAFAVWAVAGKVTLADVNLHSLFGGSVLTALSGWLVAAALCVALIYENVTHRKERALQPPEVNPLMDRIKELL